MGGGPSGGFAKLLDGFAPVPKVLLFMGFVIFCFGVPSGFTFHNRAMMIGIAVMSAGFAGHYWGTSREPVVYGDGEKVGGELKWRTAFLAILYSAMCAAAAVQAYRS